MLLTNDQRFLLDILREVRYMRLDQILPLMRLQPKPSPTVRRYCAICAMRENWSPWETISYVWRSSGGRRQTPRCCARWTFCCLSP